MVELTCGTRGVPNWRVESPASAVRGEGRQQSAARRNLVSVGHDTALGRSLSRPHWAMCENFAVASKTGPLGGQPIGPHRALDSPRALQARPVSSLAILVGAEMNAEIEHASPHGRAPGQKNADGTFLDYLRDGPNVRINAWCPSCGRSVAVAIVWDSATEFCEQTRRGQRRRRPPWPSAPLKMLVSQRLHGFSERRAVSTRALVSPYKQSRAPRLHPLPAEDAVEET